MYIPSLVSLLVAAAIFSFQAAFAEIPADSSATVSDPRCEYLKEPIGVDATKPRLSWILESSRRGEVQTDYQVLVASSKETLDKDTGDLWDSGKVHSDATAFIEYEGSSLPSRQACWWKVRIWDGGASPTAWSAPTFWEMGLLQPSDWKAKWIKTEQPLSTETVSDLHATYGGTDGTGVKDVTDVISKALTDTSKTFLVTNDALGGDPARLHVKQLTVSCLVDGKKYEAAATENSTFHFVKTGSLNYLRKDFKVDKTVTKARLFVTALGLYEVHLNGQRVGDHVLAPDWTAYNKRVRYQAYDVTPLVETGDNTMAALVGDGWYSGHVGAGGFQGWGSVTNLLAQLEVTYSDGTTDDIVTDPTWKVRSSPILSSDLFLGESYDARNEIAGWDKPGLDVSEWTSAALGKEASFAIEGQVDQPIRQTGEIHPKAMTQPKPGLFIYDMGQNMVGVVRLKVTAPAGTKITLRHAEMLLPDGTLYRDNLRSAAATDTYICKGGGEETWQPQFTFHGFRYVELSGLSDTPTNDTVTGIVIGTDIPRTGEFSCSNPDINQLQSNIQWSMRANYLAVPTDCPQRDERLGWMGDAQVFVRTAAYNGDVAAFFTKWLVDVDDSQSPEGGFADVSPGPTLGGFSRNAPGWGDAGVICPWTIYLMYGDTRILKQHLPAMARWVDLCATPAFSTGLIRDKNRGNDYGDWLSQGEDAPKDMLGTAYFAYSTGLVAKSYRAVGDEAAADKYEKLYAKIKAAFIKRYVSDDGHLQGGSQSAYAMALRFDLLPDDLRAKAGEYLATDVTAHKDHLTTGFLGVSYLLPALTSENQLDAAYRLFLQDTFPSWLFSVKNGATTIWEHWDSWTPQTGFQSATMNSFNHYSLGSCGEWMFDTVAGIGLDPDQPGFKHIIIHPQPGGNLTSAEGSFDSIHGKIATKWALKDGVFSLQLTVPPNTTATVTLPTSAPQQVTENDQPITSSAGVKVVSMEGSAAVLQVPSGTYEFSAPAAR
jgi:alpha-L-rhamnosidase